MAEANPSVNNFPPAQTTVQNNSNPSPTPTTNPPKKSKKKLFLLIGVLMFAFILVFLIYLIFTTTQNKVSDQDVALIDQKVAVLEPKLISYPQILTYSKEEKINLTKEWQNTVVEAENLASKTDDNYNLEMDLAKLYLFGHNLDQGDSFTKSEQHFKNAIRIRPDSYEAHSLLGYLYVNTSPKFAPLAEEEFLEAKKYASKEDLPRLLSGLFFAYYYQGKLQNAVSTADEYLKYKPGDASILILKKTAETQLKNKN